VVIPLVSFRAMVGIGVAMLGLVALSWLQLRRLQDARWLLTVLVWFVPLPFVACNTGWILAEVGRQPWVVYGVMRTSDGLTAGLRTSQVGFSLIALTLAITAVATVAFFLIAQHARRGPDPVNQDPENRVSGERSRP
jgi:cytochrome d ubiquinol oxidase subunit I